METISNSLDWAPRVRLTHEPKRWAFVNCCDIFSYYSTVTDLVKHDLLLKIFIMNQVGIPRNWLLSQIIIFIIGYESVIYILHRHYCGNFLSCVPTIKLNCDSFQLRRKFILFQRDTHCHVYSRTKDINCIQRKPFALAAAVHASVLTNQSNWFENYQVFIKDPILYFTSYYGSKH